MFILSMTGTVLFTGDANTIKELVVAAVAEKADLSGADLSGADLNRANLTRANLSDADLSEADLTHIKADLWDVLLRAPNEIGGLLEALRAGKVEGSVYEGECACLVGTIANVAHCNYEAMELLKPQPSRPAERWFLAIRAGHTPETSNVVKLTVEWIEEFESMLSRAVNLRTRVA